MSKSARRISLAIACLACAGSLAPAPPASDTGASRSAAGELKLCTEALTQLDIAIYNVPTLRPDDRRVGLWEERFLDVMNHSGMNQAEQIKLLEVFAARAKGYEAMAAKYFETGQGLERAVLDARFRRLEFEIALARAKAR